MAESPVGDDREASQKRGSRWGLVARIGGTVACFAVLFYFVEPVELWEHLSRLNAAALSAALVLHLIIILLLGWRWQVIVRSLGTTVPFGWAVRLTFMTTFLNLVLPLSLGGDIGRIWLSRRGGLDFGTGVAVAVLDRVVGLMALGFLTLLAALALPSSLPREVRWFLVALLPAILLALWLLPVVSRMAAIRWPALGRLSDMTGKVRLLSHRPRPLLLVIAQSLVAHLLAVLCAVAIARGLDLALSFADAFLLFPIVLLATMLPFSIGGWGVREAAAISVFALAGMPAAGALSLSLVFGLTQMAVSGIGALALLGWSRAHWDGVRP